MDQEQMPIGKKSKKSRKELSQMINKASPVKILISILLITVLAATALAERIQYKDFKESPINPNFKIYEKEILIGKGIKLKATALITSRGYGDLEIGNLQLGIYNVNGGVVRYENGLLDVDFIDIDGDGYKDIIVSGTVLYFDEKIDDLVLRREPVVFIYMFNPQSKSFYHAYRNSSSQLDGEGYGEQGIVKKIDKFIDEGRKKAQEENEVMSKKPQSERK
jgi:hypothetical protein